MANEKIKKTITKFEDIDSSAMVNIVKANRAFKGVYGGAKSGSAEIVLANKLRVEGYEGEELVVEVYKGLLGLLDVKKAKINRENEKKDKLKKASR